MNGLHITTDLDVIEDVFPEPPAIAYVARSDPKRRSNAARALLDEISTEVGGSSNLCMA